MSHLVGAQVRTAESFIYHSAGLSLHPQVECCGCGLPRIRVVWDLAAVLRGQKPRAGVKCRGRCGASCGSAGENHGRG